MHMFVYTYLSTYVIAVTNVAHTSQIRSRVSATSYTVTTALR